MGRTEPSAGRPPASFRRDARSKQAKATVNQVIPSLLSAHRRARLGIDAAELIVNPPPAERPAAKARNDEKQAERNRPASPPPPATSGPRLTLTVADTLTAARTLLLRDIRPDQDSDLTNIKSRIAILNMASPLSPGGGFLNGATSQEESLCMRTTLLPSLKDTYYRLPELGGIYTPDVLVFRDEDNDALLEKRQRFFVNCVTAAMLRKPDTDRDASGQSTYANQSDRDLAAQKMKMVMRICEAKGIRKVVLGAWGCGAYGNPVNEIASCWRRVLLPKDSGKAKHKKKTETWEGIEEVTFAIKDPGMAEAFHRAFGEGLEFDDASGSVQESDTNGSDQGEPGDELLQRIQELESRYNNASDTRVKDGLKIVLDGLRGQLRKREAWGDSDDRD